MGSYDIGISGLQLAQTALSIIGNNIANSSTSGYHCQTVDASTAADSYTNGYLVGQGVDFTGISRKIDELLESQILQQDSTMTSLSTQSNALQTIESALGELLSDGVSTVLESFYSAFEDLSVQTDDATLQAAVVSAAQTLCNQLNSISSVITDLEDSVYNEAQSSVDTINELAEQIAALNDTIEQQTVRGYDCVNLKDQRDELITELNELAEVTTSTDDTGKVSISISGIPLVVGIDSYEIEAKLLSDGDSDYTLAICSADSENYCTDIGGGTLGGLMTLRNDILSDILNQFDTLAQTIITQVNDLQVQGIGTDGSFTTLTSNEMSEATVSEYDLPVSEGEFYIRVTASDGTVSRYQIVVNEDSTLESICESIAQIPGLENTSINAGCLQITADNGYTFDFLPCVLSTPSAYVSLDDSSLVGGGTESTAAPTILVSGSYTGTTSQTYTCTVTTEGSLQELGTGTMTLTVTDELGNVVDTIDIGEDYESGDSIMLSNGLMITLNSTDASSGYFNDGDSFTLSASVLSGGGTTDTAAPTIEVSGTYTGTENQTYTCAVSTSSSDAVSIGSGDLTLTVVDSSGQTIASVNIGEGYTIGSEITLENGITITLNSTGTSAGYFNNGDTFAIDVLADSDTSGFLSAAGLNCFFTGTSAATISVSDLVSDSCGRIATSLSADGSNNTNALRLAAVGDTESEALGGLSTVDYYINLATSVSTQLSSAQLQYNNAESVYDSLVEQRDEVSGVDLNEEAIKMMAYQQMFQAMSQYITTVSETIDTLMTIIS